MNDELCSFAAQLERLKNAASSKTDTELSHLLGITQGGFSNAKVRGKIPHKWFVAISTKYGVNLEWLVSGTGPRDAGQPVIQQAGACPQCAELQKLLNIANERLYEAMRENGDLKEVVGKLKAELATLKNERNSTTDNEEPMASAS